MSKYPLSNFDPNEDWEYTRSDSSDYEEPYDEEPCDDYYEEYGYDESIMDALDGEMEAACNIDFYD